MFPCFKDNGLTAAKFVQPLYQPPNMQRPNPCTFKLLPFTKTVLTCYFAKMTAIFWGSKVIVLGRVKEWLLLYAHFTNLLTNLPGAAVLIITPAWCCYLPNL
jgi:hypothetical protein